MAELVHGWWSNRFARAFAPLRSAPPAGRQWASNSRQAIGLVERIIND